MDKQSFNATDEEGNPHSFVAAVICIVVLLMLAALGYGYYYDNHIATTNTHPCNCQ